MRGARADMAVNKAKVAVGFMVAGLLAVILGTVLTFVGPIIIDDQVVKVSRLLAVCVVCPAPCLLRFFVRRTQLSTRRVLMVKNTQHLYLLHVSHMVQLMETVTINQQPQ